MPTRAKLAPTQIAWAAGFIDGEGYIGVTRAWDRTRNYYVYRIQLEAAQVHAEPIRLLKDMFNVGNIRFVKNHKRGYWYWRVFGQSAAEVAQILVPYLVVKKMQAELITLYECTRRENLSKWRPVPVDVMEQRVAIWAACVELNGGRALQAERLSEKAPTGNAEGDAIVRSHGNGNHESQVETPDRLRLVR